MFLGTWSKEGQRCGTIGTPNIRFEGATLVLNDKRYLVRRFRQRGANVLDTTYGKKGATWTDRLTVGTTGTRLFRERSGKLINVYYACERSTRS